MNKLNVKSVSIVRRKYHSDVVYLTIDDQGTSVSVITPRNFAETWLSAHDIDLEPQLVEVDD